MAGIEDLLGNALIFQKRESFIESLKLVKVASANHQALVTIDGAAPTAARLGFHEAIQGGMRLLRAVENKPEMPGDTLAMMLDLLLEMFERVTQHLRGVQPRICVQKQQCP